MFGTDLITTHRLVQSGLILSLSLLVACGAEEDYAAEPFAGEHISESQNDANTPHLSSGHVLPPMHRLGRLSNDPERLDALGLQAAIDDPNLDIAAALTPPPTPLDALPTEELWSPEEDEEELPEPVQIPQPSEDERTPVPISMDKMTPLEDLTPIQFEVVCKAIDIMYDNADEHALSKGACAYDYASGRFDSADIETLSCDRELNDCYEDIEAPHAQIALCDGTPTVPENCDINFAQIQTCLDTVRNTQIALAQQNICEVTAETITHTRVLLNEHRKALHCLEKLEYHCPAIAAIDGE